jgi:uncharacterized protein YfaS (alpha-2-macroglobulin family)
MQLLRFSVFFVLLLSLTNQACKKKPLSGFEDREKLKEYFAAATTGVIPANGELTYVFHSPLGADVDAAILQKALYTEPAIPGVVTLTNRTVLKFKPEGSFKNGATYQMYLDLTKIDPVRFKDKIVYTFKTIDQDIAIEKQGIYINDDNSYSIVMTIKSADKINIESLKKCIKADQSSISILESGPNTYQAEVKYKSSSDIPASLEYDAKPIDASAKGSVLLGKEDFSNFKILNHYHDVDRNQVQVFFSQLLDRSQDMTGFITVNGNPANYTVNNNRITVYLNEVTNSEAAEINFSNAIKSIKNINLPGDHKVNVSLTATKPDVRFLSDGNYFPADGEMKIPVKARMVDAVRVMVIEVKQENVIHYLAWNGIQQGDMYNLRMYGRPVYDEIVSLAPGVKDKEGWTIYGLDLTEKIKRNPGALYHVSLDFGPDQVQLSCKDKLKKYEINSRLPEASYFDMKEGYYDDYYWEGGEEYDWSNKDNPCKPAYYYHRQLEQRLFICSNYGIIAKKGDHQCRVAVQSLRDLKPISGATVNLYNLQGGEIAKNSTDGEGQAVFEDLNGPGEPVVVKISKGDHITYLSLDDNQANSLTEFDISSDRTDEENAFYLYGERDVWRPGDSIYLDLMVNNGQVTIPNNLPIQLSFYNPENVIIDRKTVSYKPGLQIYNFTLHTPQSAKTGRYYVTVKIGPKSIGRGIRVETVKPNTTETVYSLNNSSKDNIYSEFISGSLTSKYLTGFPLPNASIVTKARVKRLSKPFPDFGRYEFVVNDEWEDTNIDIVSGQTDGNGRLSINGDQSLKDFGGAINLSLETETSLADGGTSKEGKKFKVFPFKTFIGNARQLGKGWNGNHTFSEDVVIDLVSVTDRGKKNIGSTEVQYVIQKHNTSWWVDKYRLRSDGSFKQSDYWSDVKNGSININGLGKLSFPKGTFGKGAYRIIFTDAGSNHQSDVYFTVYDGVEYIADAKPDLVDIQTDKDDYKGGEIIKLKLPFVPGARVLLSVERGNKIVDWVWHKISAQGDVNLPIKPSYAPGAYIHATIMQSYDQQENDLPTRIYGIKYVNISDDGIKLTPVADLPAQLESNREYTFNVSEASGKAMQYTYALVDEGLLNLTGYDTPNPFEHFNGRYSLLVKTWDIYKYLLAFFKGRYAGIISIGGDNAYHPDAIAEISRFKPVVIHKGTYTLSAGSKNKHTVKIPNYIGKVRLMVVACQASAFGSAEKLITVRNPLMVQTQMPRALNISDKITVPVNVMRDDKSITNATITATGPSDRIKFSGPQSIAFGGQDQVVKSLDMTVLNTAGPLELSIKGEGAGKQMIEKTNIAVNYPHAYKSDLKTLVIKPGSSQNITITPKGYKDAYNGSISVAGAKIPDFNRYINELIDYPYGCLEQTTSRIFGQLYIDKVMALDPSQKVARAKFIDAGFDNLIKFQKSDGKFYYWENAYYHPWADVYAGNLMSEARSLSELPSRHEDMFKTWLSAQEKIANQWAISTGVNGYYYESESLVQAYRLYILAKAGRSARSGLNKFGSSNKSTDPLAWWLIAGAYQYGGFESKANDFVTKAESLQKTNQYHNTNFGSEGRDLAIAVDVLSSMPSQGKRKEQYYNRMVDVFNKNRWVSTQDMGYAFIAAYKYYGKNIAASKDISYNINGLKANVSASHKSLDAHKYAFTKGDYGKTITVKNTGNTDIYVFQNDRFIPSELQVTAENKELEIRTDYKTSKGSSAINARLGDDINIIVTIKNPSALPLDNLALNVKMPSGWELINPRLYETSSEGGKYTYQDYRDDRVYTYFTLGSGESIVVRLRAKAAFKGDFYMPIVSCEHMYNGDIFARTASGRVVVSQ